MQIKIKNVKSVAFVLLAGSELLPWMKNKAERQTGWPPRQTNKNCWLIL